MCAYAATDQELDALYQWHLTPDVARVEINFKTNCFEVTWKSGYVKAFPLETINK